MREQNANTRKVNWEHFICGAFAGMISRTCTAPIDRLKLLSQARGRSIGIAEGFAAMVKDGGIRALWRGNGINIIKVMPESAIKFGGYQLFKKIQKNNDERLSIPQRANAAGWAALISHMIIHPIEVVKIRLATSMGDDAKTWTSVIKRGYGLHGYKLFFKGYKIGCLSSVIYTAIDLTTYQELRDIYRSKYLVLDFRGIIICGFTSSFLSHAVAYPISVVSVVLQRSDEKMSAFAITSKFLDHSIHLGSKARRLYSGVVVSLLKGIPTMSISYVVFEYTLRRLGGKFEN